MKNLVGHKIGMTSIFTKDGVSIPITIIEVQNNRITQIKKIKDNDYVLQLTTGSKKNNRMNKPEMGHFIKVGVKAGRGLWTFRIDKSSKETMKIGQELTVGLLSNIKNVDISGCTKGKGFSGTVKRWNFKKQDASHGNSLSHRAPGSIGQNQTPGRVFKGKKMAGQMGGSQRTIRNLEIIRVDKERNILLIKGSVPGTVGSDLIIKSSIKKNMPIAEDK
ncbi:50S ribosomal protein L3 [Candidatus Schneideria nysicola]|uniref:50S ribosomal protein L3 n=1 Tax=Candidatus Schneideria nysicola TaxID=1081631 RepID=UPI001CAA6BDB|nr:50S ribosomal protein L3 [Candidatus Schneideria nysicola]UAJ65981.1 50S ribosomal protein L3 [Candidatus Schneideria nysicola]